MEMRHINADNCRHIGIGSGHIAFSFEKKVIITASHKNMRRFCEDALYMMDEKIMPEIDAGLIGASEDNWRNIAEKLEEMRGCITS